MSRTTKKKVAPKKVAQKKTSSKPVKQEKTKAKTIQDVFSQNFNVEEDPEDEEDFSMNYTQNDDSDEEVPDMRSSYGLAMRSAALDEELSTGKYSGASVSRKDLVDEDDGSAFRDMMKDDKQYALELQKVRDLIDQSGPIEEASDSEDDGGDIDIHINELEEDNKNDLLRIKDERVRERQKAHGVFNQKLLFNHLLKIRILMQKPLATCNRFPQPDTFDEMVEQAETSETVEEAQSSIVDTLNDFLDLQHDLFSQNETTKVSVKRRKIATDDDLDDVWESISTQYDAYAPFREEALERWNRKTRMQNAKQFKAMNSSIVEQVKQAIKIDERLVQRCQVKRFEESILGKRDREEEEEPVDQELYDDRDFYQTLLRDLIQDVGSAVIDPSTNHLNTNASGSIRNALARSKAAEARRKLLGKTKGRTIKYNVHKKLVGFMAPEESDIPASADTLFKNIFGGDCGEILENLAKKQEQETSVQEE